MTGLNDDFSQLAVMHTATMPWSPSPSETVWRKRVELSGPPEAGRVTSVVRYDADSAFAEHGHPEGEEIYVLEGVFSDEHGDYPAGSYLLNPEGFRHAPFSERGCVLFVKLRQYAGPRPQVFINTRAVMWQPHDLPGVQVLPLYADDRYPEQIRLVRMDADVAVPTQTFPRGEEIFVIEGGFRDEHGRYETGSWVRYPPGSRHTPQTDDGCTLYVKNGHLVPASP
jgi:anti-sigma factor ChrR (cupin superfamily)